MKDNLTTHYILFTPPRGAVEIIDECAEHERVKLQREYFMAMGEGGRGKVSSTGKPTARLLAGWLAEPVTIEED